MKRLFIPLLFSFIALTAFAQQIDEHKAIETAQNFMKASPRASMRDKAMTPMKLAYVSSKGDKVNYYVFNSTAKEGGFIIVGGDEVATRILGYSNSGSFDYDRLPPNVKWWLSLYDHQINYAISNNLSAKTGITTLQKESIAPLLSSKWNQDNPYNSQIPSLGAGTEPLYTGCVATAMSQIMYYYMYPDRGMGNPISYQQRWNTGGKITTLTFSADFANTTYDWGNMLPEYTYDADVSDISSKAVGTLLYHAGVSVNMKYGQDGSSAYSNDVLPALVRNFGYDKGALYVERKYYNDDEWEDIIYQELKAGRPVYYSGTAPNGGGHAFICDGYNNDDDLYAFNWGWGGYCDGYFALTGTGALNPEGSGIGGAGEGQGYTEYQTILTGVQPDKGNDYILNIINVNDAVLSNTSSTSGKVSSITINKGSRKYMYMISSPKNASITTASFDIGVMMRETATGKTYYKSLKTITNLENGYYYNSYVMSFYPDEIVSFNGEYEVYNVFSPVGRNDWKIIHQKGKNVPVIKIVGGNDDEKVDVDFTISDLEVQVARSAAISHTKAYTDDITYTSSNEDVATVSAEGVIKGISVGNATITAQAAGNSRFLNTTKSFDIKVINTVKEAVSFEISNKNLMVDETADITSDLKYSGKITYTSSNNDVAKVSNEGKVLAIGEGNATITAVAEGNALYKKTIQMFNITVTKPVALGSGFVLTETPMAGENYYISKESCDLTVKLCNTSTKQLSEAPIYYVISTNRFEYWSGVYWTGLGAGVSVSYTFDLSYYLQDLTIGKTYTIRFYKDDSCTQPMNIPSIQVTYVSDINVNYEMTNDGYGTICLPFNASVPEGLTAYECSAYDEDGYAILNKAKTLNGRTPYILQGTKGKYTFHGPNTGAGIESVSSGLLVGVLSSNMKLQSSHYVLKNNDGRVAFYRVGNGEHLGTTAKQYSCIMNVPTLIGTETPDFDAIKLTHNFPDTPTLIRGIKENTGLGRREIYSIDGNRLSSPQRGINIIRNGNKVRKVLIK